MRLIGPGLGACRDLSYRHHPKVEMLSRTWAPSVLGYPFRFAVFLFEFWGLRFWVTPSVYRVLARDNPGPEDYSLRCSILPVAHLGFGKQGETK